MSKKTAIITVIVICVCIVALVAGYGIWYSIYDEFSGAYAGMPMEKFNELIPETERFDYLGYTFYDNDRGDPVVVRDSEGVIVQIQCYPKQTIRATRAVAEKINTGMSVFDVVQRLGTPTGSATSGMITLGFQLEDGSRVVVYFDNQDSMKVTSTIIES